MDIQNGLLVKYAPVSIRTALLGCLFIYQIFGSALANVTAGKLPVDEKCVNGSLLGL
jgi:hypothetical protein